MAVVRSPFSSLVRLVADVVARDPRVPDAAREAFRSAVVTSLEGELSRLYGGEELCMWIPKLGPETRRARDERIASAISTGEPPAVVAKREKVSVHHVRRIRGRIGGGF